MRVWVSFLAVAASLVSLGVPAPGLPVSVTSAQGALVITTQQTSYGTVLFTGDGKALYMLTFDTQGGATAAKSSCTGRCPGAWPPLLAPSPMGPVQAQGGVQQSGLGTMARTDDQGQVVYQVTYFGWPLYTFVNDKSPGQTTGENVAAFDGLWHLLSPSGQPNAGVANVSLEQSAEGSVLAAPTAFGTHRSLYLLTADPPNFSTCFAGCARFWPPLLTTGAPAAGAGVNPAGLGTLRRPDGTLQVTYFGAPLYFFAFDLAAGAKSGLTNGEDVVDPTHQGIWYLLNPKGVAAPALAEVGSGTSPLGTVLTFDKSPLYAFSADTPSSSACTGLCSRIWTPLLTGGPPQAAKDSGVNAAGLGTIQRPDGTLQVTFNGHPLYLFAKDFSGSDGQLLTAFGGTFEVVQASGAPSTAAPAERSVVSIPLLTASSGGMSAAFLVAFTSAAPGSAQVFFGSGPGCSGLVEVATRDAGAGTTQHAITVTGNDMPGSVGDNGIQPGGTYSFEVVTVTTSGQQKDDNKGACYTVTVPRF